MVQALDMVVTTKRLSPLRDRLGLVLLDLGQAGLFSSLTLEPLDMLSSLSHCSPGLHECPVCISLSRFGAQDALACRDDGWVFMAMQKPAALRTRCCVVLDWRDGTTPAEHTTTAVVDDFWRWGGFCGTAAEERHGVFMDLGLWIYRGREVKRTVDVVQRRIDCFV